jgi:hypothetical protein
MTDPASRAIVERMASVDEAQTAGDSTPEFFRAVNERIRELGWGYSGEYDLVCECDDIGCNRALRMRPDEYQALRSDPMQFAVRPGHERAGEDVVLRRSDRFVVVSKRVPGGGGTPRAVPAVDVLRISARP